MMTVTMPQLGETVTEGTISHWLKKPGDKVEKYEPFVEIATDKVSAEIPAPVNGVIQELIVPEGRTVPTGAPIAIINEAGAAAERPPAQPELPHPASNGATRSVSPAVRRLAREHHVDLAGIQGSGTGGRITANDVLVGAQAKANHVHPSPPPQATETHAGKLIPFTPARKLIAQRMVESKRTIPHAWTMVEVDVTPLWKLRAREKDAFEREHGVKLTILPWVIRAVASSLADYPLMNARFTDEGIYLNPEINVSIAVGLSDNLLLPVIRNADKLSLKAIALAAASLVEKARAGKLSADQLAGGTFTVNNTGAYGSVLSGPIIPLGQTAVITTEAVVRRPVVRDDDAIAIRSMMNVCLSLDHRVVDGSVACAFLADVKQRLEAAENILLS